MAESYQVLARRYRPQRFDEVVGQEGVIQSLTAALTQGKLSHATLFAGPRGIGKTSTARILARALNCESLKKGEACNQCATCQAILKDHFLDVIEIDGASHNRVEEARQLIEMVHVGRSAGRTKVFIIDEVHMLSSAAFNALLKTIEEPPPAVVFILATTEPERLPATIISRCQVFAFHHPSLEEVSAHLQHVAKQENITLDQDLIRVIIRHADGSLRDALTILDRLNTSLGPDIQNDAAFNLLGIPPIQWSADLCQHTLKHRLSDSLTILDELEKAGHNLRRFLGQHIAHINDAMRLKATGQAPQQMLDPELWKSLVESTTVESLANQLRALLLCQERLQRCADVLVRPSWDLLVHDLCLASQMPSLLKQLKDAGQNLKGGKEGPLTGADDDQHQVVSAQASYGDAWQKTQDELSQNKPSLAALMARCELRKLDDKVLHVVTQHQKDAGDLESPEHQKTILDCYEKHFGKACRLSISCQQPQKPKASPSSSTPEQDSGSTVVKKVVEIFEGHLEK